MMKVLIAFDCLEMHFNILLASKLFCSHQFCRHALGTAVYQTSLRHLPPVCQKSVTQPSTSLGADLRHHRSHHNTGASQDNKTQTMFLKTELTVEAEIISLI